MEKMNLNKKSRILLLLFAVVCVLPLGQGLSLHRKHETVPKKVSPVIFIPGDGGSQIDAKLDKPAVVHYICQKTSKDFFNLWLNLELLMPIVIDCWTDNARLIYDNETRTTSNSPGVETRVPGWGDSDSVEWIDPTHASAGAYFKDIGNALVGIGYSRNLSLKGAPYDFRKAPNENKQWFLDFKILIEETFVANQDMPVTLIAHSMGAPMCMVFLQLMSKDWKAKYISRLISLAGAWAGSAKAVKVFAIGDDLGSYALSGKTMRAQQISSPSLAWLMPSPLFWKQDEILVTTQNRTYTYAQLEEFFNDLPYRIGWEMVKDTIKYSQNFTAPEVEIHCIYGRGINTVEGLNYKKSQTMDGSPDLMMGDGDGTVNLRSLRACSHWSALQKPNITVKELQNVDHMAILSNSDIISYILSLLNT